jgi:hypothetical protein
MNAPNGSRGFAGHCFVKQSNSCSPATRRQAARSCRGVRCPPDVSEREFALFEMHDVVVETVGQAIGKLPSPRKWSVGMPNSVTAKNQISIIHPLIVLLLPKVGALKRAYRFRGSFDICFVAIAAGMAPETLMPATGAE